MRTLLFVLSLLVLSGCATTPTAERTISRESLIAAETGFAQSMADRDFERFASYIDDEAVFLNGGQPLRGKAAILAHWKRYFDAPEAPFAWRPELAEVSAGHSLGSTEGPVSTLGGQVIARFYSTWKRQPDGRWTVIFDNGYDVCDCAKAP
ncbi:MAG: nuclear transport factor 2 family protein [Xanthomonadales bacterium]|jgi:ketosteroid isomerase-like protein|nr:nuclear transport factor 2 family protein [Xanthomonadales bacterium]